MERRLTSYQNNEVLRVLLVRSGGHFAVIDFPDSPMIAPPKGLLYLAGQFKDDPEVEVRLLDALAHPDFDRIRRERADPPFYFGMGDDEIVERIKDFAPHVIAVTSTANYYLNDTIKLINTIRRNLPDVFIVAGGPDATNDYEIYFRKTRAIDVIVMKEGEVTFKRLIQALRLHERWRHLPGIAFQNGSEIVVNEDQPLIQDLDTVRCDYDIVNFDTYFELTRLGYPSRFVFKYPDSHKSIDIVTTRGCVHQCSFCCIHLHMGRRTRAHSVEHVLTEMEELIERHGVRNFHFEDDNLLHDLDRFKEILRGVIRKNWNITWDTPNGVRADHIDEELLTLCRQTGCTYLVFGIESGSKKVRDKIIKKGMELETVEQACKLCYEHEIDTLAFYIVGMPGETKEDLLKTYYFAFDLFRKYNATPVFQLWRPYRNTEMEQAVSDTENIGEPVIYSLFKRTRIPYTLFYSRVYEDDEITLEFLAYYFEKYLKDAVKIAFINWLRITGRKPFMFLVTALRIGKIVLGNLFSKDRVRAMVQDYLYSSGLTPFAQLHRLGQKPQAPKELPTPR